jgi:hypothetical protein
MKKEEQNSFSENMDPEIFFGPTPSLSLPKDG